MRDLDLMICKVGFVDFRNFFRGSKSVERRSQKYNGLGFQVELDSTEK